MASRRLAFWALLVIFLANFLNYTDRQLVSALEKPIREGLELNAVEYGFLWTLFTLGYMFCAVPIGFLADRISRTRIFALCIIIWSGATILSGLAQTKWILYAARVLIGVGEAGCLVIGPSLISDFYKPAVRGRALSVFYLGLPLGGAMAFILAGATLNVLDWRGMFILAGAPGFLIAVFIWVLPEPKRGAAEGGAHGHSSGGTMKDYLELLKNKTLLLIILAQAFGVFILIPVIHYGVEFFVSMHGMKPEDARLLFGAIALVGGVLGGLASGIIGDRLAAKKVKGAYALLAGIGYLVALPCLLAGFWIQTHWVLVTSLGLGCFFIFMCMPAVNTQITTVSRPAQRAMAMALAVFILHLLGDTVSPPLFGYVNHELGTVHSVTEGVSNPSVQAIVGPAMSGGLQETVRYSLGRRQTFTWFALALVPAALCCFLAALTARRDVKIVEDAMQEKPPEEKTETSEEPPSVSESHTELPPT